MELHSSGTFLFVILALCTIYTHAQSNGFQSGPNAVPDISDILRGTSVLETAVMDLSSAAAEDFINKVPAGNFPISSGAISDIHGQVPPSPVGVHVDLPGEHGNTNDFPVIHRENVPHKPHSVTAADLGVVVDAGVFNAPPVKPLDGSGSISFPSSSVNDFSNPVVNSLDTKSLLGPVVADPGIPKGIFHGENVFKDLSGPSSVHSKEFVDLAGSNANGVPITHVNDVVPPLQPIKDVVTPVKPPLVKSDGFMNPGGVLPAKDLGIPTLHEGVVKEAVATPPGDGFVSKGSPDDLLSELQTLANVRGVNAVNNELIVGGHGGVHVDQPGEHGNIANVPVVHRENAAAVPVPHIANVHVDMPGEHGNLGNTPVVHRPSVPSLFPPNMEPVIPIQHHGAGSHSAHVDLPGQHGNTGNTPVIHRELGPIPDIVSTNSIPMGQPLPVGSVHVDRPGEHGNFGDTPVVHREGGMHMGTGQIPPINQATPFAPTHVNSGNSFPISQALPVGGVHVDRPGEHGNFGDTPVVHREGGMQMGAGLILPINQAIPLGPVHVDRPGEHGNLGNMPVVHREPGLHMGVGAGVPPINQAIPLSGAVHVDMPGEHGNFGGTPVVHREHGNVIGAATGVPFPRTPAVVPGVIGTHDKHLGKPHPTHMDIHIDAPGEHGNPHNEPALHLPPGATIEDAIAAGVIPPVNKPVGGLPLPDPHLHPKHMDIHIDAPGEHGNPHNEPALHLPPGATIEDARAAGVIPPHPSEAIPLGPAVPTGVLPGTPNVPVKPNIVSGGIPTGMGVVGDKSVLLPGKGKPRRPGRRRGGRRRGGRRRGGRFDHHDPHDHHHHEPTTTTKKPPNSGLTVIRVSRPNPFGALANAVRGMLTGSAGGGLLGSLFNSAAAAQMRPPPGVTVIRPAQPPNNLLGSMLGNLFRGRR